MTVICDNCKQTVPHATEINLWNNYLECGDVPGFRTHFEENLRSSRRNKVVPIGIAESAHIHYPLIDRLYDLEEFRPVELARIDRDAARSRIVNRLLRRPAHDRTELI